MKKIIILCFITIFLLVGCGKVTANKLIEEFKDKVQSSRAYEIKGTMEIMSDEDVFTYDINVAYKREDMYRVSLINKTNNHEQIILKNPSGVYVVTPSLNKSFKFQSEWPKNSSQAYLLQSLVADLEREGEKEFEKTDDGYTITTRVSYPNNPDLVSERIYFDNDKSPEKVEVFNADNQVRIRVVFNSINYRASFKDDYFELNSIVNEEEQEDKTEEENTTTSNLEDVIYPLYIPAHTYLTNKDMVDIENGQRVIMTFSGEKNFILVQETSTVARQFEIIPVFGEPLMLNNTIAALSGNSLHWSANKRDFYLTSNSLSSSELTSIAESLNNVQPVAGDK